jgi:hypothetical protein
VISDYSEAKIMMKPLRKKKRKKISSSQPLVRRIAPILVLEYLE